MAHSDIYQLYAGWNMAGSLNPVDPQPKSLGIKMARRTKAADRMTYEDGFRSTQWRWGFMTKAQWAAFQTTAGIGDGTPSAKVTIQTTKNYAHETGQFNAIIIAPDAPEEAPYDFGFFQNIVVTLESLEEL